MVKAIVKILLTLTMVKLIISITMDILNYCKKKYFGEELMNPSILYPGEKTFFTIQVIDLRFQLNFKTLQKNFQLFEEYRADPAHARLFIVIFRRSENK